MPDQKSQHKLSGREQIELCTLLAVGYNSQRCADIFNEEYGIEITASNIYQNYQRGAKWKKLIARLTRESERNLLKHPLAKKINRLKLLQDAINEAFTWRLDRINYDKNGKELSRVEKRNIGMIASLVREARIETEVEGQSDKKGLIPIETLLVELIKKNRDNGDGFRITRVKHSSLDRCLQE